MGEPVAWGLLLLLLLLKLLLLLLKLLLLLLLLLLLKVKLLLLLLKLQLVLPLLLRKVTKCPRIVRLDDQVAVGQLLGQRCSGIQQRLVECAARWRRRRHQNRKRSIPKLAGAVVEQPSLFALRHHVL
jgi:hypothetical protein